MDKVPAALADVVEPLREADEYTRLQEIRQRGFYNVVTGLPMFFLVLAQTVPRLIPLEMPDEPSPTFGFILLILVIVPWIPFVVSCFPRLFMPLVRRIRPDWQSPLIEASLLKNSLEKHFWFQLPCMFSYTLAIALAILTALLVPQVGFWQAALAYGGVVHVIVMRVLAAHARRAGDAGLGVVYRRLEWLAVVAFLLAPVADWSWAGEHGAPGPLAILILIALGVCVVLPSLGLGLHRLLAPRRWLLK